MNITVYLGARTGNEPVFRETAAEIGKWIAKAGHRLIYGGSAIGLMGVLADAVMEGGGEVIGVEPQFFNKNGYYNLLRGMFDQMTEFDFMTKEARGRVIFADTLEDIRRAVGDLQDQQE